MRIGNFDTADRVLVIAEIGNNHEGSFTWAEEAVGRAAACGAGAVKLQTFRTEHYISPADEARFRRLKGYELAPREIESLARSARQAGMLFISTPFDLGSVDVLAGVVDAFKIASSDNTFYPLMRRVAATGKPVILSCGLVDLEEVVHSVAFIESHWRAASIEQQLAALHCVTAYPVPPAEAQLGAITALRARLTETVGYSDHTLGIEAALLAVALGAEIIEKHFTLDRNSSDFRDHKISADPAELTALVEGVARVTTLVGKRAKTPQPSERGSLTALRRSAVAGRDLAAGEILTFDKLAWTRPGGGYPPGQEHVILGRRLLAPLAIGERITPAHLEPGPDA
jgi:N,N'-diacetyllegionaminate synthase